MDVKVETVPTDRFVTADGMRMRYIEQGAGPSVLFLHGASLGSSADVFLRNLSSFADAGFRAIALDLPGFGLSDVPVKQSLAVQRNSIPKVIAALGLGQTALVAQSRSGGMAVQLALENPGQYACILAMAALPLLPPMAETSSGGDVAAGSAEDRGARPEPTLTDARRQLEGDTFNHDRISDADVALRHSRMTGRNFAAHLDREAAAGSGGAGGAAKPLWQRLSELQVPLMMIYGRQDRAKAAERALSLKEPHPDLDLHIVENCKHMVPWDAAAELVSLGVPFLRKSFGRA